MHHRPGVTAKPLINRKGIQIKAPKLSLNKQPGEHQVLGDDPDVLFSKTKSG
jgi:hypothetical protein